MVIWKALSYKLIFISIEKNQKKEKKRMLY